MSYEYAKLHNIQENEFSILYFSDDNVNNLKYTLQRSLNSIGYNTKLQCNNNIISYMNNIYEIYANPLTQNIRQEIDMLNKRVLDKMTDVMVTEIKQYIGYIKDASSLPEPISHPVHITTRNSIEYNNII